MGISWLQEPNAKTQTKGLAGDLYAVSAIRLGIRAANYALWSRGMSGDRSSHEEVPRRQIGLCIIPSFRKVP